MTLQEILYNAYLENYKEVAIINNEKNISYQNLYKKVYSISCYFLGDLKISQKIIPVVFSSSEFYVYSILGLLFSKNIFMPLDVSHPINKIKNYLLKIKAEYIITEKTVSVRLRALCEEMGIKIIYIENILETNKKTNDFSFNFESFNEEDGIYVYFTSGTTGEQKAVLGMNKSLLHFIEWEKQEFHVNSKDVFAQITSPAFDPYLRDIFTPLCSGAKICFANRNIVLLPHLLGDFLKKSEITFWHTTPTILKNLIKTEFSTEHFAKVRCILIAGEVLPAWLVIYWYSHYKNYSELVNIYGPTETTLAKVFARIPYTFSKDIVPLGTPIHDTKIYIKNKEMTYDVSDGVIGEICIETEYTTYGYLYEKKDLFISSKGNQQKIYHTGDIGYFKDNILYFIGRKDEQKKIGGIRINLNEIASRILSYNKNQIKDCIVVCDEELLAFYTSDISIDLRKLHEFLEKFLLPIHIPHKFIKIDDFAFTENGKIDRKKIIKEYHLGIRTKIFKIVGSILNVDLNENNINDKLQDIGMDSIAYVKLVVELENMFEIEIPDEDFSISEMSTLNQIIYVVKKALDNKVIK